MVLLTEVFGTGIDVVPNLPKCSIPVIPAACLGTYRTKHTCGNFAYIRMMVSWITLYANWKYDPYMVVRVRRFLELIFF